MEELEIMSKPLNPRWYSSDETQSLGPDAKIRGNRPDILERRAYHQMEIFFGEFSTEVELPAPVLSDEVTAEYLAGFLRLVFPKDRPKKIRVTE